MPIYEYQCTACGHRFDQLQKMSDAPLTTCVQCKQETLTKLVSAPSFRLSGSGWYETDFKTDKDKKKNLAGDNANPSAASESSSGDKKGDKKESSAAKSAGPKPEAKTKTKAAESAQ